MSARDASVSIVIPSYNGWHLLARTLPSVLGQRYGRFDVTVVDDASTDGTPERLREEFPGVRVVRLMENRGIARAMNAGVSASLGEYVALLNNDLELDPDWLPAMVAGLAARSDAGSAACMMLRFGDRARFDGAGDIVTTSGGATRRGYGEQNVGQFEVPGDVVTACGGASLYRRSVFAEVGPFDEDFEAYLEDVDWGLRAQLRGFGCVYVPHAIAYHMGGATTGAMDSGYFYVLEKRNGVWVLVKDWPAASLLRHAPSILVLQLVQLGRSARERRLMLHLRALWLATRGLRRMCRKRRSIQAERRIGPQRFERLLTPAVRVRTRASRG